MLPRVSTFLPLRPLTRLPLSCGSPEAPAVAVVLLAAPPGTVRAKTHIQRYFSTNNVAYSKKDEKSVSSDKISKTTSESSDRTKENTKKDLLDIIKGMKVELSTVNVQTTKPPNRRPLESEEAVIGKLQRAKKDGPKKSFRNIISDMKVARPATARVHIRPEHQIQFDEGSDSSLDQKTIDLRKSIRKNLFKGKRLNIFDSKTLTEEAPEAETPPSLWDIEFAKQLAAVNEQPFQNAFEEMIQWTKEGKLWEFPINNEAGFDDDGSEFHEHIFLDKHLEGFPKQGPIRHFMELVTCGLSKNPYLSVKQKVEHIEWFRNYFNEKSDILKENNIQFN
ncbi:small ribosomal subunit protein mS31 isoform X3 [Lepus europaeus]|uniref:small ribosomal subunit protein mS31 isoform X3 n=1 Tax=Lepus europaeus TaxID=9983 RepID=UPI002B45B5AA|nr:small ribosomal subunit protein mS31 isoform X3 [Lepus europaeus]